MGVVKGWGKAEKQPKIAPCHTHFGPGRMDRLGGTKQTQAQYIIHTIDNAFVELTVSSTNVNSPNGYEPGMRVLQVRCTVGGRPAVARA